MSKDKLKQFVNNNRDEFDDAMPPAGIWDNIEKSLPEEEMQAIEKQPLIIKLWPKLQKVAAAILIATVSIVVYEAIDEDPVKIETTKPTVAEKEQINQDAKTELAEIEDYYGNQIGEKMKVVKSYNSTYPGIYSDVKYDFQELDQAYDQLKNDLKDQAANEEVIEAMVRNYRLKLEILEDLLQEIEEKENENIHPSI